MTELEYLVIEWRDAREAVLLVNWGDPRVAVANTDLWTRLGHAESALMAKARSWVLVPTAAEALADPGPPCTGEPSCNCWNCVPF